MVVASYFGHLNFVGLDLLHKKNMVTGLQFIGRPDEECEGCIIGKHRRETFERKESWRTSKQLELVHSNL